MISAEDSMSPVIMPCLAVIEVGSPLLLFVDATGAKASYLRHYHGARVEIAELGARLICPFTAGAVWTKTEDINKILKYWFIFV